MENPPSSNETISQFEKLLADLVRAKVDFCVVGGVAIILNGYHRVTQDVDILIHPAPENVRCLLDHLAGWGEGFARELTLEDFATLDEGAIRISEDFQLDVFVVMRGSRLDDFRSRLRHIQSDEVKIPYLAPQDLIFLKQESWRDKDKLDVSAMKEIMAMESGEK